MKLCYSHLGDGYRGVDDDYIVSEGEVLFDYEASEEELRAAFPGRLPAQQAAMAGPARAERNRQLSEIYDIGVQIVRREIDMTVDQSYIAALIVKRTELHEYANLLCDVPQQSGFPVTIVWPDIPAKLVKQ
jgi:hypothetical protein